MSKDTTNSDLNDLKRNAENTKNSAKNFVKDLANQGSEALSDDNIKNIANRIVDSISDFLEDRKEDLKGAQSKCREQIKENPFLVVLGALIAGAIMGMLFKK